MGDKILYNNNMITIMNINTQSIQISILYIQTIYSLLIITQSKVISTLFNNKLHQRLSHVMIHFSWQLHTPLLYPLIYPLVFFRKKAERSCQEEI